VKLFLLLLMLATAALRGQSTPPLSPAARADYDTEYIGPPLADPVIQQAKETYVSFGCAYCHGITLTPRGEAADLMHSALVGADTNGDTIAALLRAGIPKTTKLSPMPQFSDLSDRQLHDIARYIHYARQQGRYKEIVDARVTSADTAPGKTEFDRNCASCHAADLNGIARKYDSAMLREQLLRPKNLNGPQSFAIDAITNARAAAGRQHHNQLLENSTPAQVANLIAYLQTR
jgi:mono/diheme cytochrome c family protein